MYTPPPGSAPNTQYVYITNDFKSVNKSVNSCFDYRLHEHILMYQIIALPIS
jgi:hypothetical protein